MTNKAYWQSGNLRAFKAPFTFGPGSSNDSLKFEHSFCEKISQNN